MKSYRVAIFASVNVQAVDEADAEEQAVELIKGGQIRIRDYEFEVEDREVDSDEQPISTLTLVSYVGDEDLVVRYKHKGIDIYPVDYTFDLPFGLLYRVAPQFETVELYFETVNKARQWIDLALNNGAHADKWRALVLNENKNLECNREQDNVIRS